MKSSGAFTAHHREAARSLPGSFVCAASQIPSEVADRTDSGLGRSVGARAALAIRTNPLVPRGGQILSQWSGGPKAEIGRGTHVTQHKRYIGFITNEI